MSEDQAYVRAHSYSTFVIPTSEGVRVVVKRFPHPASHFMAPTAEEAWQEAKEWIQVMKVRERLTGGALP